VCGQSQSKPVGANYYVRPVHGKAWAGTIQPQLAEVEVSVPKQFAMYLPIRAIGWLVFADRAAGASHAFHHADALHPKARQAKPHPRLAEPGTNRLYGMSRAPDLS
jgi:hypothetical protein